VVQGKRIAAEAAPKVQGAFQAWHGIQPLLAKRVVLLKVVFRSIAPQTRRLASRSNRNFAMRLAGSWPSMPSSRAAARLRALERNDQSSGSL
jgi:hypothetical protein